LPRRVRHERRACAGSSGKRAAPPRLLRSHRNQQIADPVENIEAGTAELVGLGAGDLELAIRLPPRNVGPADESFFFILNGVRIPDAEAAEMAVVGEVAVDDLRQDR